jgi:hypothetical protein
MKLSDIKGEAVFDVIADLTEPIANIAQDKDATSLFERQVCPDGVEPRDFMLARVKRALPKLMKNHKRDLATIMAVLHEKDVEEYLTELTMATFLNDFVELLLDDEFIAFLS